MATQTPVLHPAISFEATVDGLFSARGDHFETVACERLDLAMQGIPGDLHSGYTRMSGSDEPWYSRGTEIRSDRQLSILSRDELAQAASNMNIDTITPEWVGANMTLSGVPNLTFLPAGTLLLFDNGASVSITTQNKPCRIAGEWVAKQAGMEHIQTGSLAFVKAAEHLRGLYACVEKSGRVSLGETVKVRIPEQWVYSQ